MRVTICGPNLRDQSKGTFHVHAEGCGDIARKAPREPAYCDGWTIQAHTREDVIRAIYSDHIEEAEREYAYLRTPEGAAKYPDLCPPKPPSLNDYNDIYVFPCCHESGGVFYL